MAKTVKKAIAPEALKKEPAAKKAPATKINEAAAPGSKIHLMPATHDQIAQLAHKFWADRGHQHGHHEDDWLRAEQELRGKAS